MIPRKNLTRVIKKATAQPSYAFENLNHRLKASLAYNLFRGRSFGPETISIFLTYSCNLKCMMCGQWGEKGIFKNYDRSQLSSRLSLEEIQSIIDDVKRYKPNITLFGGEPMLYPNWIKVVEIVKTAGLSLWMTAYIFPGGAVRPYHTMNFSPGTIRKNKFTEIWNNEIYRNYRHYIKKHKCFSVCSKGCTEFFRY